MIVFTPLGDPATQRRCRNVPTVTADTVRSADADPLPASSQVLADPWPAPPGASPAPLPSKPRLRGWIHFWSFVASVAAGGLLVAAAAAVSQGAVVATLAYSVTVCGLFGISALYHRRTWASLRTEHWMRRLDHSMIFLFIAGSYTPFATIAMPPSTGTAVLQVVWGGALAGVTLKLAWPGAPRWLSAPVYIALGWVAVFVVPGLLAFAGPLTLALIVAGGVLYTVGAVIYALRRPDPWPHTFGFHEIFHSTTVLAAVCHYIAIWLVLLTAA